MNELFLQYQQINENEFSVLAQNIAEMVKLLILKKPNNIKLKGSKTQIKVFTDTLLAEKAYVENAINFGIDAAATIKAKLNLDSEASKFHDFFGFEWPIC